MFVVEPKFFKLDCVLRNRSVKHEKCGFVNGVRSQTPFAAGGYAPNSVP